MKKFFAAVCAAVMVLGSTFTAFAAPSSTTANVTIGTATVKEATAEGTSAKVEIKTEVDSKAKDTIKEAVVEKLLKTDSKAKAAEVLTMVDVKVAATAEELAKGVKVTFAVDGIKSKSNIKVLHYVDGNWKEEKVNSVAYGKVTATFYSFSPVAIVEVETEGTTSDGTGVGFSTLSLIAAAGLAGAVVCGKKKSN